VRAGVDKKWIAELCDAGNIPGADEFVYQVKRGSIFAGLNN